MFALMLGVACTASAQKTGKKKAQKSVKTEQVSNVSSDQEEKLTLTKEVYPQKEENSNLYHGLTKKLTFDRMIPPHGLEVTYDKTVHILFPASVKYVDLGSEDLIAGKADGAENVIRVKAAVKNFKKETNMSVITENGSFYTFNVKYAKEPLMLNIEMADFIHDGEAVNRPNNAQEIYLKELGKESPMLVHLIMKSIHKENKRKVKHIGSKRFGIQYLLKGIYVHSDLLYFHTEIKNQSNVPFDVDYITFKVVDKKVTHGKNFVLLSATLNGFARPSMVAMLEHFMGNGHIAAWEPIYTGDHSFQMIPLVETAERETVTVTGNLCTGTDLVLSDADMPKMEVGDTVVFPNAGSYAAVISPMQFASQPKPAQLFLRADGTVVNTDF